MDKIQTNRGGHYLRRLLLCLVLLLCEVPFVVASNVSDSKTTEGTILIIASYNPDTRRMSDFITEFEELMGACGYPFKIIVEDLGCKGVDEAHTWKHRLNEVLLRYDPDRLRAVILLGQEAWASFLSQNAFTPDIPFFGCFVSENGILLPTKQIGNDWMPASVNMLEMAQRLGLGGGYINQYDFERNIKLIRSLYPEIRHVAFVTDNTYGGISLQALVRSQIDDYPQLTFSFIDGRQPEHVATEQISNLPHNSVILLGTWRVGRDGQYFMYNSINSLLINNPTIPVFTLSGTGLDNVAIGGYMPIYQNGAAEITRQIDRFYKGKEDAVFFTGLEGVYRFDKKKLLDFRIPDYRLPKQSIILDNTEIQFRKYRSYILIALSALCILLVLAVFLYYLYYKNRVLKEVLQKREHELIGAKEKAEESDRLKSAFLANMSHEIRTPLNAIVGFSSLLKEDLSSEERAEYSNIITTNSELMLSLIGDILDISRLETGKIQFNYEEVDVVSLCQHAIVSTTHNRKPGVESVLESAYTSYVISTDQQRLLQVLNNLLINAGKYTEHGRISVGIEVFEEKQLIQFSVTDTGSGIPLANQGRVFNRFEKLDEFKQGTGLGLAICKQIVHHFEGEIWVDPEYTGGCRMVFTHRLGLK